MVLARALRRTEARTTVRGTEWRFHCGGRLQSSSSNAAGHTPSAYDRRCPSRPCGLGGRAITGVGTVSLRVWTWLSSCCREVLCLTHTWARFLLSQWIVPNHTRIQRNAAGDGLGTVIRWCIITIARTLLVGVEASGGTFAAYAARLNPGVPFAVVACAPDPGRQLSAVRGRLTL